MSVAGWASQVAKIFFLFYIEIYNLLNIDRVISKGEVRKGREVIAYIYIYMYIYLLVFIYLCYNLQSTQYRQSN